MSRTAKISQYFKSKARKDSLYLSWPSNPLIATTPNSRTPVDCPLQVPNLDCSLEEHPLTLVASTFYLLAPKQREQRRWRPWITKVEKVNTTTWRVLSPLLGIDNLLDPTPSVLGRLGKPTNYLIKELASSYTLVDDIEPIKTHMKAHKVLPMFNQGDHVQLLALKWDGTLALLNKGHGTWMDILPEYGDGVFVDIAAYHGRFYATDRNDGLYIIDGSKARFITEASDHAIFDSTILYEEDCYGVSSGLSLLEYDGQLCLLKFKKQCEEKNAILADVHNWEVIKSLRNKILFKMNEVCFALPAHLLDRMFQGDWICSCNDALEQRNLDIRGVCGGIYSSVYAQGIESMKSIFYPRYHRCFDKCYCLETDTLPDSVFGFNELPDEEYISLFFKPPPWIQYYCLDAHQDFPPVRFDKCYFPKYDFDYCWE